MKKLIVGNWKMNKSFDEAKILSEQIVALNNAIKPNADLVLCPTFTSLQSVSQAIVDTPVSLGAQNLYPHQAGAFTGEITASMLKDFGAKYVILGHSERRQFLHESDEFINEKVIFAQSNGLMPILCVGETLADREADKTYDVIKQQLLIGINNASPEIVIAYEPVWAIGTGKTATPEIAQEVHAFIRDLLVHQFESNAQNIHILYGGSMKPGNARDLLLQKDINGGLIGGASLVAEDFLAIARAA